LVELGGIGIGGIKLVVVIQPEQGKNLIDGIGEIISRYRISWPSWYR